MLNHDLFNPQLIHHVQYCWAAAIAAIASLAGSYLSSRKKGKKPPENADYKWQQRYGPGMWDKLSKDATGMIDNPYGIPQDIRNRMYSTARNTAEAGYGAASRTSDRTAALSGLSPTGGDATRRQYYAGQQMAEGLNQAYGNIDIQDYMAREDQKNRGYNMLFSLSNKSPVYSQIASQNYWNALNASQESANRFGSLLGGTASNLTQVGMDYYNNRDRGNTGYPYGNKGGYDAYTYGPESGSGGSQPPQYNPYDEFGSGGN